MNELKRLWKVESIQPLFAVKLFLKKSNTPPLGVNLLKNQIMPSSLL